MEVRSIIWRVAKCGRTPYPLKQGGVRTSESKKGSFRSWTTEGPSDGGGCKVEVYLIHLWLDPDLFSFPLFFRR